MAVLYADIWAGVVTDGAVDITKVKPVSFDPFGNAYFGIGAKVGNAFKDGVALKFWDFLLQKNTGKDERQIMTSKELWAWRFFDAIHQDEDDDPKPTSK